MGSDSVTLFKCNYDSLFFFFKFYFETFHELSNKEKIKKENSEHACVKV